MQIFWKIVQFVVVTAIIGSNIQYQWTPNGYAAAFVAIMAAYFVTAIPIIINDRIGGGRLSAKAGVAPPEWLLRLRPERYRAALPAKSDCQGRIEQDAT